MSRLLPKAFLARLTLVLGAVLAIASGALLWQSNSRLARSVARGERARLVAIATTVALQINGDLHEAILRAAPDRLDGWRGAPPALRELQRVLADVRTENHLVSHVDTLVTHPRFLSRLRAAPDQLWPDAMLAVASSRERSIFRHLETYRPAMADALAGQAAVTAPYDNSYGTWVSAFAPIRNSDNAVVGLVRVDAPLDSLLDDAEQHTGQLALFAGLLLLITLSVMVVALAQLTRALSQLSTAAEKFGAGDFESPIEIAASSATEVHQLAGALEGARQQIAESLHERIRTSERLALALDQAEDAARTKSSFLANMSHELRTPMNAIIGYSEILLEEMEELSEQHAEARPLLGDLEKVHRSARQLLSLINDILDLSKLEAGKMKVYHESFDIQALASELVETMEPLLKDNTLTLDIDERLTTIWSDRLRLRQILLNLLGNATKFTTRGVITLSARPESAQSDRVIFEVEDTGIGMTAEQMAELFQPFTQVDPSSTRRYSGTGLGLALCREFSSLLGGEIAVESEVDKGTTFRVTLPAKNRTSRP